MSQSSAASRRFGVFVLTVVLVVVASAAGPFLFGQQQTNRQPADYPEYSVSQIYPQRADSTGTVEPQQREEGGVVVIDLDHSNRIKINQLQPLIAALNRAGYEVDFNGGPGSGSLKEKLGRADAYIVVDPGQRYSSEEIGAVERFVKDGGRLLMVGEPTVGRIAATGFSVSIVPVQNKLTPLSNRFGIQFGEGYLYNMETNDGNFRNIFAKSSGSGALLEGVDRVALDTAVSVETNQGKPLLQSVDGTRNSRGENAGTFNLAVRNGNVLAIGDKSFITGGTYNVADNEQFIANVVDFLTSGDRQRDLLDYPYNIGPNPTVGYTSAKLLGAAQTIGDDLRARGDTVQIQSRRGLVTGDDTDVLIATFDYFKNNQVGGVSVQDSEANIGAQQTSIKGVYAMRAPQEGVDLIIVADNADRAETAAQTLVNGNVGQYAVTDRTAIVRTVAADQSTGNESSDSGFPGEF
ncbi:MAG: DUF4350 domain-containing protein [Halobacteriales archaeon]|nr:DUF4350 domain-containing protein [Halobacteriales archaeon]